MALTMLDPTTGLIIVDLQQGIVGLPVIHPIADIIAQARSLADAFRARGLPVVLVNVAGIAPGRTEQPSRLTGPRPDGWTDLIPELDRQPGDIVVTKWGWGAFATTDLEGSAESARRHPGGSRGRGHGNRRRGHGASGL
jgi:nicotinamidase-related amidase